MNRKDSSVVFEADQRIDIAAREQQAAKRRAAGVDREARGQNETDTAARARERHGALNEELVAVGVSVGLGGVDAGLARETQEAAGILARRRVSVSADHVPRRIAQHRIESPVRQARAVGGKEHFGTFELPVEKPPQLGDFFRGTQILIHEWLRECALGREKRVGQRAECLGRHCVACGQP